MADDLSALRDLRRVSLIIPCFNAAPWLAAAVESALDQTRPPDQIIIVDDGSTDSSLRVASGFGALVQSIARPHAGISAARNCGLEAASGQVIAFLDADDLWPHDSLRTRLQALAKHPEADYAFGQVEPFADATGDPIEAPRAGRLAGALLVRRRMLDRVGGFDAELSTGETIDWVARADAAGCIGVAVNAPTLRRRVHDRNTVRDEGRLHRDYLTVLRRNIARRRPAAAL